MVSIITKDDARGHPCHLLRRVAAILYDGLIVIGLWMTATLLMLPFTRGAAVAAGDLWYQICLLAVAWIYYAVSWRWAGQTLGMRAWKIFLQAPETPVGWRRMLLRFAVAWLSAAAAGVGFWWSLFHPRRATWHDLASGTRLVVVSKTAAAKAAAREQ